MYALGFPKKITDEQVLFLNDLLHDKYRPIGFEFDYITERSIRAAIAEGEYNVGQQCLFNDLRKKVLEKLNE